jgi:hypothetical protein
MAGTEPLDLDPRDDGHCSRRDIRVGQVRTAYRITIRVMPLPRLI